MQTPGKWGFILLGTIAAVSVAFFAGTLLRPPSTTPSLAPLYSSGWQDRAFFDAAYAKIGPVESKNASSILSAHHLLVADKMVEVFEVIATDRPVTVVLVGPNHFNMGLSAAQTSFGNWETPYGVVEGDAASVQKLLDGVPVLRHEEMGFAGEHSIGALTPFVARSLPHARIVPMMVHDSLSADDAWHLGRTIARVLPDAILVASVDMAHYMDADAAAAVDAEVLERLENGWWCDSEPCLEEVKIDSNASMRILAGFNEERGDTSWVLTHHGSSLEMGATSRPEENTSHILGYFLQP